MHHSHQKLSQTETYLSLLGFPSSPVLSGSVDLRTFSPWDPVEPALGDPVSAGLGWRESTRSTGAAASGWTPLEEPRGPWEWSVGRDGIHHTPMEIDTPGGQCLPLRPSAPRFCSGRRWVTSSRRKKMGRPSFSRPTLPTAGPRFGPSSWIGLSPVRYAKHSRPSVPASVLGDLVRKLAGRELSRSLHGAGGPGKTWGGSGEVAGGPCESAASRWTAARALGGAGSRCSWSDLRQTPTHAGETRVLGLGPYPQICPNSPFSSPDNSLSCLLSPLQ